MGEFVAVAMLALVLVGAVVRPRGLPEVAFALPAAIVVVVGGLLPLADAWNEVLRLFPVVAFLAAVLVISELCDADGLFRYAGALMAARSRGSGRRLLGYVFVLAAAVTAVLSLDATVVLLTPVVLATASGLGLRSRPHAYACAHLANAGSLLLPVSNLTNLLAMSAAGLSFVGFAGLMTLPWLAAIAIEYVAFRLFFAADLSLPATNSSRPEPPPVPRFSVAVLALTLAGFVVAPLFEVADAWVALAGAAVLLVRALRLRQVALREVTGFVNVGFLVFVLCLGVVVAAVVDGGLGTAIAMIVPQGSDLVTLLLWAFLAALLANLVNNLPAVLVLLPFAASTGAGPVLAVLIGVNVGPNLTYVGSLATLLWRRILHAHDQRAPLREFTMLGLLATPAAIVAAVVALWFSLLVAGGVG
ncbi:arsenical pump membrane protein [Tessaracoccus bendigoensis DSM 12906]|uniref:Arsenical pump membrane protein n=2 Tax=Tessaracoccus TaxID=72763 RepID=A0A1M6JDE5_9ACTN|nr:SLC13 family permease [Tessaracoccus bendigoensis]SHJ44650.1 arsenical pump membrane protein [Tessaracoccus bendigoensis DSM 12906]